MAARRTILAAAAWFCCGITTAQSIWAASPPNIILIVADDLGHGDLGCYGQEIIKTPNIDQLAKDGARFTQFYSGSPVCAPSRCVLLTGKHSGHAAIRDNQEQPNSGELSRRYGWEFGGQRPLPDDETTIAALLRARGYATAAIGKWGLGNVGTEGDPTQHGFDSFYGFTCQRHAHNHYPRFLWRNSTKETLPGNDGVGSGATYSQDRFIDEALRFLDGRRQQPFLLYLPLTIPHLSLQVPHESLREYADTIPEAPYKHKGYLKHPTPRAAYAAMITHMDRGIGQIIKRVDDLGLANGTLILFTSDNGPTYDRLGGSDSAFFRSSGNLRGLKGSVYEGGIRVPLVVRWPGHTPAGATIDAPAAFWDLLPTLCEVAGAVPPKDADGLSLLPTLTARPQQQRRQFLYWEFPAYGGQQAVRLGPWKAVRRNIADGSRDLELYNLTDDAVEAHNVALQHPDVVQQCAAILQSEHVVSDVFPLFPDEGAGP